MLFIVITSYKAICKESSYVTYQCDTIKVAAENKDEAKRIAWQKILEDSSFESLELKDQIAFISWKAVE